jgi:hypothetical protein
MDNIVSMRGDIVPPGKPDPDIIKWLEALLADARAGDIRAIAFVALRDVDTMKCWYRAHPPFSNALIGGVQRLGSRLLRAVESDEP